MSFIGRSPESAAKPLQRRRTAMTLALATLLGAPAAFAADGEAAQRVSKDPVTGELRHPSAAEAQALEAPASDAAQSQRRGLITKRLSPQVIRHPNGMRQLELDESTMTYSMATRNPDGTTDLTCVTGSKAAEATLKGPRTAATKKAEDAHAHK